MRGLPRPAKRPLLRKSRIDTNAALRRCRPHTADGSRLQGPDGMTRLSKRIVLIVAAAFAGAAGTLLIGFVLYVNDKPDLDIWHTIVLENEFTIQRDLRTFDEYLLTEDRVFDELQQRIIDKLPRSRQSIINRFTSGSLSDPGRWPNDWNRSYEMVNEDATAGVLLLHGLSDSPYSLRHIATHVHAQGAWVLGMRLPGHGTTPSGLTEVSWQDMAAAIRLAMVHLREKLGTRPLFIVGYSNGAALAIHYALTAIDQESLPHVQGMVLISPAVGITPVAEFAIWQARLGKLLGLDKLAWYSVIPEYDPYKYQSFAINAGHLQHELTVENQRLLSQRAAEGRLQRFPPTLAFLSAVDATVSTRSVVEKFFMKLEPNAHQLVVFDLNRRPGMDKLYRDDPGEDIEALLHATSLSFDVTVVTNLHSETSEVGARRNQKGADPDVEMPLNLSWPDGTYSLSHVALPFPPDDPLYGGPAASKSPGLAIGNVALRGEKDALEIAARDMLRQRWNPFYPVILERTDDFLAERLPSN